jgi:peptide/nickel transport system ATP-binding protein
MMEIEQLTVSFGNGGHRLLALDRVDLRLAPGRVLAVVGESGAGKTTLGKALMGLLPESAAVAGNIRLARRELIGLDETALNTVRWSRVAMVFQNGAANLNPVWRIVDQVAEPLIRRRGIGAGAAKSQAENALREIGISPSLARRFPHELSGGEIQLALLAMALILDPEVLILDEPTGPLDALTKRFVSDTISGLRNRGKAILLITHDLEVARRLGDDLATLYLGRIMETMPAPDLFETPRHPYTVALARSFPRLDAVRDLGGIRGDAYYRMIHAHAGKNGSLQPHSHAVAPGEIHENGHAPSDGCLFRPRCTQAVSGCDHGKIPFQKAGENRVRCLRGGIVAALRLEAVSKRYGSVTALSSSDLTLRSGEVFCLVGETGSGKTTLAMIAAGVLRPDTGRRVFEEREMEAWLKEDRLSLARRISVVYQNPGEAVSRRLNVFDIVSEPLVIQGRAGDKAALHEKVLRALADVHLPAVPEFLGRFPHELNTGSVQRLCIARALIAEPSFIVADEPTSSLDPGIQAKIMKLLLELQIEKGLTLLFVTHDLGLARKIGDRIGVMAAGRLVETGPSARVMHRPGHPYTRLLIGCAAGAETELRNGSGISPEGGCFFACRCDRVRPRCRLEDPAPLASGHAGIAVSCFYPDI